MGHDDLGHFYGPVTARMRPNYLRPIEFQFEVGSYFVKYSGRGEAHFESTTLRRRFMWCAERKHLAEVAAKGDESSAQRYDARICKLNSVATCIYLHRGIGSVCNPAA